MSVTKHCNIIPGFCPSCGDILPALKEKGSVNCYSCRNEWSPQVFGEMISDYVIYFNRIDALEAKQKDQDRNKKKQDDGPVVERKCTKCGNDNMTYAAIQLRSADEGQTVFYTCTSCGFKETENS